MQCRAGRGNYKMYAETKKSAGQGGLAKEFILTVNGAIFIK